MRIEGQFSAPSAGTKKAQNNKAGQSFQQTLAATAASRRTEDVLTISHQPTTEEVQQKPPISQPAVIEIKEKAAADEIVILPKDSTETKLEKLRQIADAADYTGMSYTEIYCTIWDRYNSAFGGNMSAITSCLWPSENWCNINNQFVNEIQKFVYHPLNKEVLEDSGLRRGDKGFSEQRILHGGTNFRAIALGYQTDNYEDCEVAILQKYAGKNTLVDFLNMQGELFATGVMDYKLGSEGSFWYRRDLGRNLQSMFFPDPSLHPSQGQFDAVLHFRVNIPELAAAMRHSLSQSSFSGFNVEEAINEGINDLLSIVDRQQPTKPTQEM